MKLNLRIFFKHGLFLLTALFLIFLLPLLCQKKIRLLLFSKSKTDEVSSASIVLENPDGNFYILINRDKHKNEKNLSLWIEFFLDKEISFIFEDILCLYAEGDESAGKKLSALSCRLPKNQMKIKKEDPILLLSRAECGKFDTIIMSQSFAKKYMFRENDIKNVLVIKN